MHACILSRAAEAAQYHMVHAEKAERHTSQWEGRSQTASPTMVSGKNIWMPKVFCQFSMSESIPAVRIKSMSEHVMTGTSHDLRQRGNGVTGNHRACLMGRPTCSMVGERVCAPAEVVARQV